MHLSALSFNILFTALDWLRAHELKALRRTISPVIDQYVTHHPISDLRKYEIALYWIIENPPFEDLLPKTHADHMKYVSKTITANRLDLTKCILDIVSLNIENIETGSEWPSPHFTIYLDHTIKDRLHRLINLKSVGIKYRMYSWEGVEWFPEPFGKINRITLWWCHNKW